MRKTIEDMFYKDLEDIQKVTEVHNNKSYSTIKKELEEHAKFWDSLTETQQEQFRQFERINAEDNAVFNKETYIYAFNKALSLFFTILSDNV